MCFLFMSMRVNTYKSHLLIFRMGQDLIRQRIQHRRFQSLPLFRHPLQYLCHVSNHILFLFQFLTNSSSRTRRHGHVCQRLHLITHIVTSSNDSRPRRRTSNLPMNPAHRTHRPSKLLKVCLSSHSRLNARQVQTPLLKQFRRFPLAERTRPVTSACSHALFVQQTPAFRARDQLLPVRAATAHAPHNNFLAGPVGAHTRKRVCKTRKLRQSQQIVHFLSY